jgi:hypothetical protein
MGEAGGIFQLAMHGDAMPGSRARTSLGQQYEDAPQQGER